MPRKFIIRQGGASSDSEGATPRPSDSARQLSAREQQQDEGEIRKIQPMDSVYSFLMFTLPMELKLHKGRLTWRCMVAVALVIITLSIKGILLYAIFKAVVMEDLEWQHSILTPDPLAGQSFLGVGGGQTQCNTGESLCAEYNGVYSCAPPTVQLMGRWNELDINGDGVWSHEEAVASRDELKCKYVVDPVEVFDVFVKFVLNREKHIWIHPDLREGRSIHKAYFTYASGDLIMCGYRTAKMCSNLLQRGVFDAPLRDGVAPRVGTTIDSAINYCYDLLDEGGTCDRNLPSSYAVWKTYSEKQCWGSTYEKYVYKHPTNGHEKSMLTVDYKAPKAYARVSNNNLFRIYKGIIIGLFLLAMYAELKDILVTWTWVLYYPAAEDFQGEEVIQTVATLSQEKSFIIQSISKNHRYAMGGITALRFFMVSMLIWVGVSFLMRDTDWVNLLLNGVALVFIMEVASSIFSQVLDPHLQEQFLSIEPMYVDMVGNRWLNKHPALRDLLGFASLCLVMFVIMQIHLVVVDIPLSEAVECACLSEGGKCREANSFDHSFWNNYWVEDVPNVFSTVEKLKLAAAAGRPIAQIKMHGDQIDARYGRAKTTAAPPAPSPPPPPPPPSPPPRQSEEVKVEPMKRRREAEDKNLFNDGVRWHIVSARKKEAPIKNHNGFTMLNKVKAVSRPPLS